MPKLLLIENGKAQEIQMGQELTIGRAYSNLLRLEGEEISRVHAIIYRRGEDYVLRDLDSKNGILLNGQKVVNALLGSGDQINVGEYTVLFDPPQDYDVSEFLKRHDASMESEVHTTRPTELDTSYVFGRGAQSALNGSGSAPESEDEVFFATDRIDALLGQQHDEHTGGFGRDLLTLHRHLGTTHDGDDEGVPLPQRLLAALIATLGADRGVVVYRDGVGDGLSLAAIMPGDKDVAVNRVVLRTVLRERKAVLCNDAQTDKRFSSTETVKKDKIGSLISFPIMRKNEALGLVYLDAISRTGVFKQEHLLLICIATRIMNLAGSAVIGPRA